MGKRKNENFTAAVNKRQDSLRFAAQVEGFSFINKPFVLLKEKPSPKSMTMAKIYLGSYVFKQGFIEEENGYVAVNIGKVITGYVKKEDIVDSIGHVQASAEELVLFKSREYYKFEETAEYKALTQPVAEVNKSRGKGGGGGRTYHVGPKGGCFYINANGNKVYVDHSYCN